MESHSYSFTCHCCVDVSNGQQFCFNSPTCGGVRGAIRKFNIEINLILSLKLLSFPTLNTILKLFSFRSNYRYAAYCQFTWWVHNRLGRYLRKVIPACVVKTIRRTYPREDGNYTGFRTANESYSEVDMS